MVHSELYDQERVRVNQSAILPHCDIFLKCCLIWPIFKLCISFPSFCCRVQFGSVPLNFERTNHLMADRVSRPLMYPPPPNIPWVKKNFKRYITERMVFFGQSGVQHSYLTAASDFTLQRTIVMARNTVMMVCILKRNIQFQQLAEQLNYYPTLMEQS